MSDIVERLRADPYRNFTEAIDEIYDLRAEIERLRKEVQDRCEIAKAWESHIKEADDKIGRLLTVIGQWQRACESLKEVVAAQDLILARLRDSP